MASTSMSTIGRSTATSSACARNSRRLMRNSPRSKPSMASAIDIATAEAGEPAVREAPAGRPQLAAPGPESGGERPSGAAAPGGRRRVLRLAAGRRGACLGWRRWPSVSPLTRRIVAVHVLPLALLAVGFLYLGKFEGSLIGQQIESLHTQGEIFAAALSEGAVLDSADEGEVLLPDLARQMMRRLVAPTKTRARLFDVKGDLIADSRVLRGPGGAIQVFALPPPTHTGAIGRLLEEAYAWIVGKLPRTRPYATYHESFVPHAADYSEVERALSGEPAEMIRRDPAGGLVLSVAIPVQRYKQVLGALMLSTSSAEIEQEVRTVRFELLRIFAAALFVTVLLSLYLAGTI